MTNTAPHITMPGHIIIKLLGTKDKKKIFHISRRKKKTHDINRRTNIITAYYLSETMEARKQWDDILKCLEKGGATSATPVKNLLIHENYFL